MFRATAKCNMDRWITCVISTSTGTNARMVTYHFYCIFLNSAWQRTFRESLKKSIQLLFLRNHLKLTGTRCHAIVLKILSRFILKLFVTMWSKKILYAKTFLKTQSFSQSQHVCCRLGLPISNINKVCLSVTLHGKIVCIPWHWNIANAWGGFSCGKVRDGLWIKPLKETNQSVVLGLLDQ